jgi:hypothetical protein
MRRSLIMSEAMKVLRPSEPASESTWCVILLPADPREGSRPRIETYHDTHEEALTCAREIIASHAGGRIPFVLVCKIHEQNGDK